MRTRMLVGLVAVVACGGEDRRTWDGPIPGGGIGNGALDGALRVYVVDAWSDAPLAGATVSVGADERVTDAAGLAVFDGLHGPQTIAVRTDPAQQRARMVWAGVDGATVTIPVRRACGPSAWYERARLTGTLTSPESTSALVLTSSRDKLFAGDAAFLGQVPHEATGLWNGATSCDGGTCTWSGEAPIGTIGLIAALARYDNRGTPNDPNDDTSTIVGWAAATGVDVVADVPRDVTLAPLADADLQRVAIDLGAPPPGFDEYGGLLAIEVSPQITLPLFTDRDRDDDPTVLLPRPSAFGAAATYQLTAVAGSSDLGQTMVRRSGLTAPRLGAVTWLAAPSVLAATATSAAWTRDPEATYYELRWMTDACSYLEARVFDAQATSFEVPPAVAFDPAALGQPDTLQVRAVGIDVDVRDLSYEADADRFWGMAARREYIPR